jgi:hypothetical protein
MASRLASIDPLIHGGSGVDVGFASFPKCLSRRRIYRYYRKNLQEGAVDHCFNSRNLRFRGEMQRLSGRHATLSSQ